MIKYSKIFLFLSVVYLLTACNSLQQRKSEEGGEEITLNIPEGINLVGKVSDGKQPIAGAVVSDGYTTTTTNKEGIYHLAANVDSARFVFVSVPAEYEIPLDEYGIPKIYQDISALKKEQKLQRNFTLKKGKKEKDFTLVALADVQIRLKPDVEKLKKDIPHIQKYIASLKKPVYGVSLGDLVWDSMDFYSIYRDEIAKLGIPIFQAIGNHDHDLKVENSDLLAAPQFEETFGPTYYSYNIGDCHFVMLDDVDYLGGKGRVYSGNITSSQLNWLKEDLSHVAKDKLIIIGLHIPTKRRISKIQVKNNADLYKILEGYNVRILSGHSHVNYTTTISDRIEENTLGSVMGEFWTGEFCNDGSPKGYAIYEISGSKIKSWYYKGTYHDRNHQMKVYAPGEAVDKKQRRNVLINIFTWHTNWTVTAEEDGAKPFYLSKNIRAYDRDAYDFLGGKGDKKKPALRGAISEAHETDHTLFYTPKNSNWKKIVIKAKDPYGNVYTETLSRK